MRADAEHVDFYSCCSESVAGNLTGSMRGTREFRSSFSGTQGPPGAAPVVDPPAQISIEPMGGRSVRQAWGHREVFRVRVNNGEPKSFVFSYAQGFSLEVDGYRVPWKEDFKRLRDMALGQEPAPHAEWKLSHADDKNQLKAWTRAPPDLPWLAPPEMMKDKCRINQVRVEAHFDCPARHLYDVMHDAAYRKVWDDKMIEGKKVAELTPRADIGYYAANLPSPLSNRDFCNLRTWMEMPDNEFIIMNYSVKHDDCPEQSLVRASSYGSGYFIKGTSDSTCLMFSVSHTDMKTSVPAWVINGKIGAISCGIIPKLRDAAANYEMYQRLNSLPPVPPWRTPVCHLNYEDLVDGIVQEEGAKRGAISTEWERSLPTMGTPDILA
eukprot:TRINITY_DN65371_c0_g1_i1.p1 TRINITY_DN65371_c0_g1~~TRINITY_DN65371_c0_g1_i1.p1  ORF type:complete len:431 (+),score=136.25 TRINITY_DN65371_c0_g1_i1:153-1295(+)